MTELKDHAAASAAEAQNVQIEALDIAKLETAEKLTFKGRLSLLRTALWQYLKELPVKAIVFMIDAVKKAVPVIKGFLVSFVQKLKAGLAALGAWLKQKFIDFKALPTRAKVSFLLGLVCGGLAIATVKLVIDGKVNLGLKTNFLNSFADVADAKFEVAKDEVFEDFTDPLNHPGYAVTMDRVIVNLRRPADGSNSMGLFAFYFETSNQDSAVELRDRESEARDIVLRTLEQMPYEDLATVPGKEKLKVNIRKNLNALITKGQVRRVFIKTFVIKM
jgi:flagellar basal body-associated protein FliL